jgi:hypothetical protein
MRIRPWTRGLRSGATRGEAAPPAVDARLRGPGRGGRASRGLARRSLGRGEGGPSPRPGLIPQAQARVIRS